VGLLIIQLLRVSGVTDVYAVDPLEYRARAGVECGGRAGCTDLGQVLEHTGGRGCDLVIEATNSEQGMLHAASDVTAASFKFACFSSNSPFRHVHHGCVSVLLVHRKITFSEA
jgi:threonine dehydrogenase-like Zn-dependent dehydrogenase